MTTVNTQEVEPKRKGMPGKFSLDSANRPALTRMDSKRTTRRHSYKSRISVSSGQLPRHESKSSREGSYMPKTLSQSPTKTPMTFYVDHVKNKSEEIRAARRRSSYGSGDTKAAQRRTSYGSIRSSGSVLSQDLAPLAQSRRSSSKSFHSVDSTEEITPGEPRRSFSGESIGSLARKLSFLSIDSIPMFEIACSVSRKNSGASPICSDNGESLRSLALKLSNDLTRGEHVPKVTRKLSREASQQSLIGSGDSSRTLTPRTATATTA